MSHKICGKNVKRDTLLAEIALAKQSTTPSIWDEFIKLKQEEFLGLTHKAISFCPLCKRFRYAETDAMCNCRPAETIHKIKVLPRVVGLQNRHMIRSKGRDLIRILKKLHRYARYNPTALAAAATPIHSGKFVDEAKT
jgi:hypothetical protein